MSEHWRMFVAIELPNEIIMKIKAVQVRFKQRITAGAMRWTNPASIHLTLKFLGNVELKHLDVVKAVLSQTVKQHSRFLLTIDGVGCFPNSQRPRVLWLGVDGATERLETLQQHIEEAMDTLGIEPDDWKYSPHLTLARTQRSAVREDSLKIGEVATQGLLEPVGRWPVEGISLMRSQLKPSGAEYSQLHHVLLAEE